jgi:hypothetical protein
MDAPRSQGAARSAASQVALLELRAEMERTGTVLAAARSGSTDSRGLADARRDHVTAMTAYEEGLRALHLPVPPKLRDALRLQARVVAMSDPTPSFYTPRTAR